MHWFSLSWKVHASGWKRLDITLAMSAALRPIFFTSPLPLFCTSASNQEGLEARLALSTRLAIIIHASLTAQGNPHLGEQVERLEHGDRPDALITVELAREEDLRPLRRRPAHERGLVREPRHPDVALNSLRPCALLRTAEAAAQSAPPPPEPG